MKLETIKEFFSKNKITIIGIIILIILIIIYCHFSDIKTNSIYFNNEASKSQLSSIDSDKDSINDYDEINIYKTDPYKNDSDDDGILDNVEMQLGTSLTNPDTDADGLLDGKAQYANNKKIAPIDPEPLIPNGLNGIWKKQIEIQSKQNIPTYLTTFYEYDINSSLLKKINDINWEQLIKSNNFFEEIINLPLIKELSSKILMFRLDNGGTVLHSQTNEDIYEYLMSEAKKNLPNTYYAIFQSAIKYLKIEENLETWQKQFGFNSLYDDVFRVATNNNMRSAQLYFNDIYGNNYVLWLWRGDYLALGSGAEMGLYKKNTTNSKLEDLNIEHWDAIDFEVPMTLNLYNYYNENKIEQIFSWNPNHNQWWITGFNPNFPNVDVTKHVIIGTVNFKEHTDMYNSLKENTINNSQITKYVIFDDEESTIWINWYD